jgi:CRISPR-associated protein Cpf1
MLIDKLNYLIDKNKPHTEIGGALKALQLTTKFESFKDISKQSGFLFYVPAWNTSKMDPVTGFVNLFNTNYENEEKSKEFFKKFNDIRYNSEKNWFEFSFDYNKFHEKAKDTRTKWVVIGDNKERYTWDSKSKKQLSCKVAENLENLFGGKNILYGNGQNLVPAILEQNDARFFKELLFLLKTLLSLRHNNGKTGADEEDYILSPVMDKNGNFFDSRKALNNQPNNADSNGAYNIARKGLLLLNELDNSGVDAFDEMKYKKDKDESKWVSNKQWLQFVQQFN